MKKRLFLLLVIILSVFWIKDVNASTKTFERTNEDLRVPDYINVTEENKSNILLTPSVDAKEKVYDFADLFDDQEEKDLYDQINKFIKNTNMDLAVVTISYNNKHNAGVYSDDFYDYNNFGRNASKDGILFLIDMSNREIYMTTTGYAINMYDDYRINKSLDQVYKYMTNKNYYQGVSNYISIISNYAKSGLPSKKDRKSITSTILISFVISTIITIIIIVILIRKNKMAKKKTTAREYLNKESIIINKLGETLISTHTSRIAVDHSSSGGSSTHSGSSGTSHGGGGHGF